MAKIDKVDLQLLKRLVAELESTLSGAELIKGTERKDINEYVVEMQKAAGLAAGVMQEATLIVLDVNALVRSAQGPGSKSDALDKLLGALKGGGFGGTN